MEIKPVSRLVFATSSQTISSPCGPYRHTA